MRASDDESRPDGGQVDRRDIFTTTSDIPPKSRLELTREWMTHHLYAPIAVAWEDWRVRIGATIIILYLLMGTVGVLVVPQPRAMDGPFMAAPLQNMAFPLGTDTTGSGLFRQIVHATPVMFKMMLTGALFSVTLAAVIGTLAGYKGGRIDKGLMVITDVVLTIPGLALIIVLAAIFTPKSPYLVGLILGIDNWPGLARTIRSQVLSLREQHFVEASRAMGMPTSHILRRDLLSQLMPYVSINIANSSRKIIFESVGLYFIGVLPFTTTNWGVMMNLAYQNANLRDIEQLHWLLIPMFAIAILSFGLVLTAQGLDRVFNVRLRARHVQKNDEEARVGKVDTQN